MAEILQWAGNCFGAVLGLIFFLIPGTVFWLVVIGGIVFVHRWKSLWSAQDRAGHNLAKPRRGEL
jgi:hypothetical protein